MSDNNKNDYIFARFKKWWRSEFEAYGFCLFTGKEYKEYVDKVIDSSFEDLEAHFGTNGTFIFKNPDDYFRNVKALVISEEEYKMLKRLFEFDSYGHWIDILEAINYQSEWSDE